MRFTGNRYYFDIYIVSALPVAIALCQITNGKYRDNILQQQMQNDRFVYVTYWKSARCGGGYRSNPLKLRGATFRIFLIYFFFCHFLAVKIVSVFPQKVLVDIKKVSVFIRPVKIVKRSNFCVKRSINCQKVEFYGLKVVKIGIFIVKKSNKTV